MPAAAHSWLAASPLFTSPRRMMAVFCQALHTFPGDVLPFPHSPAFRCFVCGEIGHLARDCRGPPPRRERSLRYRRGGGGDHVHTLSAEHTKCVSLRCPLRPHALFCHRSYQSLTLLCPPQPPTPIRSPPRRGYNDSPPRRAYGNSPPRRAYGNSPPRRSYNDSPPRRGYNSSPPPRRGYDDSPPPRGRSRSRS